MSTNVITTGKVLVLSDAEFEAQVLKEENQLVLVYFWASWCGPCRLVAPSVEAIAATYADRLKVIKMEVDPNPQSRDLCKVEGLPAIRLFRRGELLASLEGAITKQKLIELVEQYI